MIDINNFNSLLLIDKYEYKDKKLNQKRSPKIALLTAWVPMKENKMRQLETLIRRLINLGCECFICVGSYSESLHDFIDEIILDISLKNLGLNDLDITTTWHDDDTNEEVAHFFLYAMNVHNSLLVAFLDSKIKEDFGLKKAILKKLKCPVRTADTSIFS